jgi:hypothetical protein
MFTYELVLEGVVQRTRAAYSRQLLDSARFEDGAFFAVELGCAAPDAANHVHDLACACYAYLCDGSPLKGEEALFLRIQRGIGYSHRAQRPSGLIDLIISNMESPPDTAFVLQLACPLVDFARRCEGPEAAFIAEELGTFVEQGARGIVDHGFHTPNHRWVVCSALAWARTLFPGLDVMPYVNSILSEGIDINSDGEFTERSTGIYSAVCDRSLRMMADHLKMPELLDHVRKNLDLTLHLLHDDCSVVTSFSVRNDKGMRIVPVNMADSFFDMAMRDQNGVWAAAADAFVSESVPDLAYERTNVEHSVADTSIRYSAANAEWGWLLEPFVTHPEYRNASLPRSPLPNEYNHIAPEARLWRVRRGKLSATAAAGSRNAFALRYGDVDLKAVRLFGSHINSAKFEADEFEAVPNGVRMTHRGAQHNRPKYDLPLGRPVPFGSFANSMNERGKSYQAPLDIVLTIVDVRRGFNLSVATEGGMDRIPFQIECCFRAPGDWETSDNLIGVRNGQTVILKSGYGTFHVGNEGIRIGPGAISHRMFAMRNSDPEQGVFRVLLTGETPFVHTLEIRYGEWSLATGSLIEG